MPTFVSAQEYQYDLGLKPMEITLSVDVNNLLKGQQVRVYTFVNNMGSNDATGNVVFFVNNVAVGDEVVSVKAGGVYDEVFVDFIVPEDDFYVYVKLQGITPSDEDPANNDILSPLFHVQGDNDFDGLGDNIDNDDDNDGLTDEQEQNLNTDKDKKDTDGDGVLDNEDEFPLDPEKQKKPEPKPEPKSDPEPAPVVVDVPKQEVATPPVVTNPPALSKKEKEEEKKAELVEDFYKSPEVELLEEVRIVASQVNWNTFDFSFSTNVPGLNLEQLEYTWDFGDGVVSSENGHHKYNGTGKYFVMLSTKGPFENYLYDSVKVNIAFWSVFNYWLWLIALIIILFVFMYVYEFRHKGSKKQKINKAKKQEEVETEEEFIEKKLRKPKKRKRKK